MAEWCNSFDIVPKPNSTIHLCLDTARLNPVLIRPNIGPTLSDELPKLTNTHHTTTVDASTGCHNLKLDKNLHT